MERITGGVQGPTLGPLVGAQGTKPQEALSILAKFRQNFDVFSFNNGLFEMLFASRKQGTNEEVSPVNKPSCGKSQAWEKTRESQESIVQKKTYQGSTLKAYSTEKSRCKNRK